MERPIFDLKVADLEVEVNSYVPGNGLAWRQLFPLRYSPRFTIEALEGDEGIPVSADRVAFSTKAPLKTRKTVGKWSGKLAKYSISREKDEIQINEYKDLKLLAAANKDKAMAQYLVDMVYDDIKYCNQGVDYKVEIDAMRIGSRGLHTFPASIEGDMATEDVINFNVPEENFVGVTTKWSDATNADGIADIVKQQKAIVKAGKRKPMFAFLEDSAFELLLAQAKTIKRCASVIANATNLASSEVLSIESVNAYMRKKGYPQFIVMDTYATIEDKEGNHTTIKPWNEKVVVLSPVAQLGWTYYKPVPNIENTSALQVQGSYSKTTAYSENNPMKEVTLTEAYVQPGLINRGSLVFMNVDNTTGFNSGE